MSFAKASGRNHRCGVESGGTGWWCSWFDRVAARGDVLTSNAVRSVQMPGSLRVRGHGASTIRLFRASDRLAVAGAQKPLKSDHEFNLAHALACARIRTHQRATTYPPTTRTRKSRSSSSATTAGSYTRIACARARCAMASHSLSLSRHHCSFCARSAQSLATGTKCSHGLNAREK